MQLVHTHCDGFNSSCTISFKKGNFFVEKNQYWSQKLIQKSLVPLGLSKSNMYLTKQIICVNYNRKYQLQKFQKTDMSSFLLHTDLPWGKDLHTVHIRTLLPDFFICFAFISLPNYPHEANPLLRSTSNNNAAIKVRNIYLSRKKKKKFPKLTQYHCIIQKLH